MAIPDFDKDTTLLMVLRLATATCSPFLHRAHVIGDASDKGAQARQQRDAPPPQFDVDNATDMCDALGANAHVRLDGGRPRPPARRLLLVVWR